MDLIADAVAALVPRYVQEVRVPGGTLALSLFVYFDGDAPYQLAPEMFAIPRAKLEAGVDGLELFDPHDPEGWEAEDVEAPNVDDVPEVRALLDHLNGIERDQDKTLRAYLAALQAALHDALGVIVFVLDTGYERPPREQLRAQLSAAEWAEWESAGRLPAE